MARKKDKKKDTGMGWDAEDADEAKEAEALKGTQMDSGKVDLYDTDKSSAGIETYDEDTGELEGAILLKDGNTEGLLALVKIIEEVSVEQDHEGVVSALNFSGKLNVENPSPVDRLWDIDVTLGNIASTNLESENIKIRELGVNEDDNVDSRDFEMSGDAKNLLLVKEYINTLPDADTILNLNDIENDLLKPPEDEATDEDVDEDVDEPVDDDDDDEYDGAEADQGLESYAISIDKDNEIHFVIAMRSLFDTPIKNVKVVKDIPVDFTDVSITDQSVGMASYESNQIIWEIDELEPETTVLLKFTTNILVTTKDPKRTGTIEVTYEAASSFAEISIEKFDAYTRNRFYVDTLERDEEPGVWDCQLVFANSSEFIVELFNADVYAPEDESTKLIDIDPNDVPKLPSGAEWHSVKWQYESEDFPKFKKLLEFRVVPDFQTVVNGAITVGDVELSVASIVGEASYDITQVPTFKEKDVIATLKLTNDGSAPLNEITIMQDSYTEEFNPPTVEEIKLTWAGNEIELAPEAVEIEMGTLKIILKDLKDASTGMLNPDDSIEVQYPIHCLNPSQDATMESVITMLANTYPVSTELETQPEVPVIEAVHIRRKFRIGKEVAPIGALGQYQITLSIENIGDMQLQNLILLDKVPDSFEYGTYSEQPTEINDEVGSDTLKWVIETLEPAEKREITYEIIGQGEYKASDAQMAF